MSRSASERDAFLARRANRSALILSALSLGGRVFCDADVASGANDPGTAHTLGGDARDARARST